jgi:hypothetical protein
VRKIKEVLRLRFELGLGLRAIARSCSIGLGTAHEYLQRAEAAGVTWPLGGDWDEDRLEAALFGGPPRVRPAALPMPDFAELHRQRQQHAHVTQQLLWEEYRQANPDGYRYSRFCELYQRWRRKQDVVLRSGAQSWREAVCRLGWRYDSDLRSSRRTGAAGAFIRRSARRQFVHLRRGDAGRTVGKLDRGARAGV